MDETNQDLSKRLDSIIKTIRAEEKKKELADLEKQTLETDFWKDHRHASNMMKKIGKLKKMIDDIEIMQIMLEEDDKNLPKMIKEYETLLYMSGQYDEGSALFSIHAGQGGTEAMDWTAMLYRMYTRFFEKKQYKCLVLDLIDGEEAGIKSVTLQIDGLYAYGYMKAEAGVHRLVRQSPFNANSLRQTSFSLVEVLPVLEAEEVVIKPEEIEWQFFRSGGHGGQNVNKVSTAVRLIHKTSGIVISSQQERYQEKNRENALKLLRAKLWKITQENKDKKMDSMKGPKQASWGLQIRSYVLHPYKLVKDLRTGVENTNPDSVLDGNIEEFIDAYLKHEKIA